MGGYKHKQLMGKSYDEIQKLFDKEMKRVNTFVAMGSEAQEGNKVEGSEEKDTGSRKKSIWRYTSMIRLLQGIDREDLQTLWKLVKTKHGDIRPEDEHERVLWGDLKVVFEPDIKSDVWRNIQGYKIPLTPITFKNILNKKLQTDHLNEMCY
ncbi:hypothetical protein Tco_0171764 [Tanacetum coccineum]